MTHLTYKKTSIRSKCLQDRARLSAADCRIATDTVTETLSAFFKEHPAAVICTYYPIQNELSPIPFLNRIIDDITLVMPRYNAERDDYEIAEVRNLDSDLVQGNYDIQEPASSCPVYPKKDVSLWLIPGLAFDHTGARIGFGSGIYDRLLADTTGLKVGLAHDFQLIKTIPQDDHDIKMDFIITPSSTYDCRVG